MGKIKVIVEVDERSLEFAKECKTGKFTEYSRWLLSYDDAVYMLANSIPLDNIKAEVKQLPITDTAVRLVTEILDK